MCGVMLAATTGPAKPATGRPPAPMSDLCLGPVADAGLGIGRDVRTPPGWFNIGHSDGVITYAAFGTPVYEGLNYYDLGGYGDAYGPIGDGIAQSFATTAGATRALTTLSFIHTGGPATGNNDPLIDGVSVTAAIPEAGTYALMLLGLGAVIARISRRRPA
jgi:hypothetical protein